MFTIHGPQPLVPPFILNDPDPQPLVSPLNLNDQNPLPLISPLNLNDQAPLPPPLLKLDSPTKETPEKAV